MNHAIASIVEPPNISLSPLRALASNEPDVIMSASAKSTSPLDMINMQHLLELSSTDFHINKSVVNINICNKLRLQPMTLSLFLATLLISSYNFVLKIVLML